MDLSRWTKIRERSDKRLDEATESFEQAKRDNLNQSKKRDQEEEMIIRRIEKLAEDNHLASLVWDVVTGNGSHK